MKILLIALCILIPTTLWAAPFIVCDPYPTTGIQPNEFEFVMDAQSPVYPVPETLGDGSVRLKYDVGGVSVGQHSVLVKACINDPVWGRLCSIASPFDFTRPQAAAPLSGIGLSKE